MTVQHLRDVGGDAPGRHIPRYRSFRPTHNGVWRHSYP